MCRSHPAFSLPESPLFKNMFIHACSANNTYKPRQYEMSGNLLDANYVADQCDQITKLLMNVDVLE
jgi:hypothetical protein